MTNGGACRYFAWHGHCSAEHRVIGTERCAHGFMSKKSLAAFGWDEKRLCTHEQDAALAGPLVTGEVCMAEVIVSGSINDFGFGPAELQIADGLSALEEAHAVLDAILHADTAEQDELTLRRVAREDKQPAESPQDRATHYGFTALQYRCANGKVIKIL